MLDEALSKFGEEQTLYRMDRMELNLGQISLEDPVLIREKLISQIEDQLHLLARPEQHALSLRLSQLELLFFFLKNGFFPWWTPGISRIEELEKSLQNEFPLQNAGKSGEKAPPSSQWAPLAALLKQDPQARLRLVFQFRRPFFLWLLQQVYSAENLRALQGRGIKDREKLLDALVSESNAPILAKPKPKKAVDLRKTQEKEPALPESVEPESSVEKALEDGITASHAGIVLLHPFLSPFFTELGLLKEERFITQAAQVRAIHLLHFLATGQESVDELQTPFYKLLCALPFSFPIRPRIRLHAKEKQEAEHLLRTVIGHWEILKNTTIDGLREGFLQRSGILRNEEKGFRLTVEQNSIDILLDRLPWGISVVKLPWMEKLIYVDWP